MNLIHGTSFDRANPIAQFICADFKPKTSFYKWIDNLYDIRRRLKLRYRYYADIFHFNQRNGDCLKIFTNNIKLYNLIVAENRLDEATETSIRITLKQLREHLIEDGFKTVSICAENIHLILGTDKFESIITEVFGEDDVEIVIFNTNKEYKVVV